MKQFCTVHHFYYASNKCPFCETDKINSYAKRYNKNVSKEKVKSNNPNKDNMQTDESVTDDMLDALVAKFKH
jgi:hypothetical protein